MLTVVRPVAELDIQDRFGGYHRVRALIDSCNMINFITERLQKTLQLTKSIRSVTIEELNNMQSNCNQGSVECDVTPHESNHPVLNFTAIISKNICSYQPKTTIDISKYNHLRDLKISPSQTSPNCIDLLLGAELVPHIFTGERRIGDVDEPAAIGSIFGWLLMGKTSENNNTTANISLLVEPSLDQYLQKFWELDQVKNSITEAPEDIRCEGEFVNNYQRMDNSRFMVKFIFKTASPELGQSYSQALRRFLSLEKRLIKNSTVYDKYKEFMEDYLAKGHMSLVPSPSYNHLSSYYIPHHPVLRANSSKIRVVFDASAKTSNGYSLNDLVFTGPKLQNDLVSLISPS
nr:uncharacterized protein LOC111420176 [Onthophagus taurus]